MRRARENLKFMEDMVRMAGSFTEVRSQIKGLVKDGLDRVLSEMDMVTRAEFDRVEAVAVKARERQEQLEKRIRDLEKQLKTKKAKK
jgi:BMFP domain-containing protein YqiC